MKIIKQHDEKDCGATCLLMIARFYGLRISLQQVREMTHTGKNGVTLYGIAEGSKLLGFDTVAAYGDIGDITELSKDSNSRPFIIHFDNNHFVVVYKYANGIFYIADPAVGARKLTRKEVEEHWTGYLITFNKNNKFDKHAFRTHNNKYIVIFRKYWKTLLTILFMSIVITLTGLLGTYLFQSMINNYVSHETMQEDYHENHEVNPLEVIVGSFTKVTITSIFITILGAYFIAGIVQFWRSYLLAWLNKKINADLVKDYYAHLMNAPMSIINTRMTGEYITRFSDISIIRNAISGAAVALILDGLMMIVGGGLLYIQCRELFAGTIFVVLAYVIIVLLYKNNIERMSRKVMETNAQVQSYVKETVDGVETVKANNATKEVMHKFHDKFSLLLTSIFKGNIMFASEDAIVSTINTVGSTLLVWYGIVMVSEGKMTIGALVTFYLLLGYFITPIKNLVDMQPTIQQALVAVSRLNDIYEMKSEETNDGDEFELTDIQRIEYKNVSFSYDYENSILKDISLEFSKGDKIAIVGKSGSGKSTLAKLLLRLYEVEEGIYLNGIEIHNFSLKDLRRCIVYINQETFLFSDTILNNIILGNESAASDDIEYVCSISGIDGFVSKLPAGLNTILNENGSNLSSGQRQRIAIARALLNKPQVIIFDETTSNLDKESEKNIQRVISELQDTICIMITHNIDLIQDASNIYMIQDGRITGNGKHDDLLHNTGYRSLFQL